MTKAAYATCLTLLVSTFAPAHASATQVSATIPLPPTPDTMRSAPTPAIAPMFAQNMDHLQRLNLDLRHSPAAIESRLRKADRTRWERAARLADLVNDGRCHEAYDAAIDEADQAMAQRIAQVCTDKPAD